MVVRKKSEIKRNTFKLFLVETHFGPQTVCPLHSLKSMFWPALNKLLSYWNCEQWMLSHHRRQHLRSSHTLASGKGSLTACRLACHHFPILQTAPELRRLHCAVPSVGYGWTSLTRGSLSWRTTGTAKTSSVSWRPEWDWGPEPHFTHKSSCPLCLEAALQLFLMCTHVECVCVARGGRALLLTSWVSQDQNTLAFRPHSLQGKDSHTVWPQACDWNLDCGMGSWVGWRERDKHIERINPGSHITCISGHILKVSEETDEFWGNALIIGIN